MRITTLLTGVAMILATGATGLGEETIQDRPVSQWIAQLQNSNRGLQVRAARALAEAPASAVPAIIPRVLPILKSERENDKFVVAQVLGEYGPIARAAVPDLLPMLEGTQFERNRAAAAKALGQILQNAKADKEVDEVTAALIGAFTDAYEDVRREAVTACGMIGPAAKACIPHLTPLLNEPPGAQPNMVSVAAAGTCERMGLLAKEHVDLLISLLHRYASNQTPAYVLALGAIGPIQDSIVANIVDAMERGTAMQLEYWAVLEKFGPKASMAVPYTRSFLAHGWGPGGFEQRVRAKIAALKFLQAVGTDGKEALPEVKALTEEQQIEGFAGHWGMNATTAKELSGRIRTEATKALAALSGK